METRVISLSIAEIIQLKYKNTSLENLVKKLKEESSKNLSYAQRKTSEINVLEGKTANLENKCRELENVSSYMVGKCEAYEAVIKQLIGGQ